jgi:8-oxo-dGTP pyrophosphatase MutT (NUDIX family)
MVITMKLRTNTRVRGFLVTSDSRLMLIRRVRPGQEPYWVFPGGGVEAADKTAEGAMAREVAEELGGVIEDLKLVYILHRVLEGGETQDELYFLCRLIKWDGKQTGPEFAESGRGEYVLDMIPVKGKELTALNIKPVEVKEFLAANIGHLEDLPDLRNSTQTGS